MIGAPSVLVLGLGEGGGYLAQALAAAKTAPTLLAYDAAIASPDAAALREKASTLGLDLHEDIGEWVGAVDFVFSLVPGSAAVAAARTLRPVMRPGAVFVDLNSITAAMVQDIAAMLDVSLSTVERAWRVSRARLHQLLTESSGKQAGADEGSASPIST